MQVGNYCRSQPENYFLALEGFLVHCNSSMVFPSLFHSYTMVLTGDKLISLNASYYFFVNRYFDHSELIRSRLYAFSDRSRSWNFHLVFRVACGWLSPKDYSSQQSHCLQQPTFQPYEAEGWFRNKLLNFKFHTLFNFESNYWSRISTHECLCLIWKLST